MVALQLNNADRKASAPVAVGQYVLTKVSKGGVRYFFRGETDPVELADRGTVQVAQTSLFFGDARVYEDIGLAEADAAYLNLFLVSEAKWQVKPANRLKMQWGLAG
ncbi:hypothetical protein [Roseibium litorale]|uniref:Uncharacterized protein n=1 Tax=Roseibium litorale TaxID=2803841 RepID=A0ABR9CH48_9HYPH|nr:hypothetical protein [Roseibium litorale]MBD8890183.1 hypothetical protein [Roseibium litorale]